LASITLSTLRDRAVAEADAADIFETSEIDQMINDEAAELYELIVEAYENYYVTTADLTITAGNSQVALPDGSPDRVMFKLLDVEDLSESPALSLPTFEYNDRNRVGRHSYCIAGDNLLVRPVDRAPGAYRIHYVPEFLPLTSEADTFTAPNNWELAIVFGVAQRLKESQDQDGSALGKRKASLTKRIERSSRSRNAGAPRKARDVKRLRRTDPDWWGDNREGG